MARDVTLIATGSEVVDRAEGSQSARGATAFAPRSSRRLASTCFASSRANTRPAYSARVPRIGVEAAIEGDWARWLGDSGEFVGMTGFGASAPAEVLYREFGITAEAVRPRPTRCLARSKMAVLHS